MVGSYVVRLLGPGNVIIMLGSWNCNTIHVSHLLSPISSYLLVKVSTGFQLIAFHHVYTSIFKQTIVRLGTIGVWV